MRFTVDGALRVVHTGDMKIITLNDVPAHRVEADGMTGVTKQVPVGVADGSPTMSMRVFTVEPGGHTPRHHHPWEHINYILAGSGVMVDADGAERPVRAGDCAFIAPDEEHQFRNTNPSQPLQFVCLVPTERE